MKPKVGCQPIIRKFLIKKSTNSIEIEARPGGTKFKRCSALCHGVNLNFIENFKLTKQDGSIYSIRCFICAFNEKTTEARIYLEISEQIEVYFLKNYCRHHSVNLIAVDLFTKSHYQQESNAAINLILDAVDSDVEFELISHGKPRDDNSSKLLDSFAKKTKEKKLALEEAGLYNLQEFSYMYDDDIHEYSAL